jgi:hypothetical protein
MNDYEPVSDSSTDSDGHGIHFSRVVLLPPEPSPLKETDIKLSLRSNATAASLRATNVVVSSNKGTQIGTSFGRSVLPYEKGDKILVPGIWYGVDDMPSSSVVLPQDTSGMRRVEIHAPDKNVNGNSLEITITNELPFTFLSGAWISHFNTLFSRKKWVSPWSIYRGFTVIPN